MELYKLVYKLENALNDTLTGQKYEEDLDDAFDLIKKVIFEIEDNEDDLRKLNNERNKADSQLEERK